MTTSNIYSGQSPLSYYSRRSLLRLLCGLLAANSFHYSWARQPDECVITLFQGATDSAVALGITPCAVVESWTEKPTYRYLRQTLQHVPHVGLETQPSLEDIALLQPTLIVGSRLRHQAIMSLLKQIAPVVMLDTVYEFKQTLLVMGQALQRHQRVNALITQWQQRIARLGLQLKKHFADSWPVTVSLLEVRADHLRSYLPNSFAGSILHELGFRWNKVASNSAGTMIKLTNKESLPVINADIFFVMLRDDRPAIKRYYQGLTSHPLWRQMQAVQHQQVWPVDGVSWSLSGGIIGANLLLDDIERQVIQRAVT